MPCKKWSPQRTPRNTPFAVNGIELLETRTHLDAVAWTGAGGDLLWHNAANWYNSTTGMPAVPTIADDVVIDIPHETPLIQFTAASGSRGVRSLFSREPLQFTGGTLTVGVSLISESSISAEGTTFIGGEWDLTGIAGMSFGFTESTLRNVALSGTILLDGQGDKVVVDGTTTFTEARLIHAETKLRFTPGRTLTGRITFEGPGRNVELTAPGTLTIAPGGEIISLPGASGERYVGANATGSSPLMTLLNHGVIRAESSIRLGLLSLMNHGLIEAASGSVVQFHIASWTNHGQISGTNAWLAFSGTWQNQGSIELASSTLTLESNATTAGLNPAQFFASGSTIVNIVGTLDNTDHELLLGPSTGVWRLLGGTIVGGAVSQEPGFKLRFTSSGGGLTGVAVTGELDLNEGPVTLNIGLGTTFESARLRGSAAIRFADGYVLTGTLWYEGSGSIGMISGGLLTVGHTGSIRSAGLPNQSTTILSSVINYGVVEVSVPGRRLTIQSSQFTNHGIVLASGGSILDIRSTNWSTVGTMYAEDSTVQFGGSWTNIGGISVTECTVILGGTITTAGLNSQLIERSGGSVNLSAIVTNTDATLQLDAGTGSWSFTGAILGGSVQTLDGTQITSSGGVLDGITLNGELAIAGATTLQVRGGLTLNGSITLLPSVTYATTLQFYDNTQTLNGSGEIVLGAGSSSSRITFANTGGAGGLTIGAGIVIRGNGGIQQGFNGSTLTNNGTIRAETAMRQMTVTCTTLANNGRLEAASAGILRLVPTTFSNDGVLAISGGTLDLGGTFSTAVLGVGSMTRDGGTVVLSGVLNNQGSTLALDAQTGSWQLSGTVSGGLVTGAGGASLVAIGGLLTGVELACDVLITNGQNLRIGGNLVLNASITVNSTGTLTYLNFVSGTQQVDGGGQIVLAGHSNAVLRIGSQSSSTVTVSQGISIRGRGSIIRLASASSLVSAGTITADVSGATLTVNPGSFTNVGVVAATGGATLSITASNLTNYASGSNTLTGGTWIADQGSTLNIPSAVVRTIAANTVIVLTGSNSVFAALNALSVNSGELALNGGREFTLIPGGGAFINSGIVRVSAGSLLQVIGDYSQNSGSRLEVEVSSGPVGHAIGRVVASGAASLSGTGVVTANVTFDPEVGIDLSLISYSSVVGTFDNIEMPEIDETLRSAVLFEVDRVRLIVTYAADWSGDFTVDVRDIFSFLSDWFAGRGDVDGNGQVEVSDIFYFLSIWFLA